MGITLVGAEWAATYHELIQLAEREGNRRQVDRILERSVSIGAKDTQQEAVIADNDTFHAETDVE
jgi:hypothetical protein